MYWYYLTNTKNHKEILTFESNSDYNKLYKGYNELVIDNFFSSFSRDYDAIFISKHCPDNNPIKQEIEFLIKFDDINKARKNLIK